uniref:Retrovirus-related Pol polyprotein from transposon TNT 1-94 n=1 Tax=Tanacetum cinerariifolium TaxID=118510 RepID=A0A6L2P1G7_TANCI|nr:retrovirus-related Pol polyprotein from transposon TNT 1-94 [Tanacetum cinerariifolium]
MDIFAFIHTPNPTKVKFVKRERKDNEPRLLKTTVDRIVPLLPVAPDRAESELDAVLTNFLMRAVVVPRRNMEIPQGVKRKGKPRLLKVGGSSHPPKKLREDHGTLSGPSIAGKSRSTVQRLLAGAVLNAKVRGDPIPTFPFVTCSVSATLEREGDSSRHSDANVAEAEADSLVRFSVSMMTAVTTTTLTADPAVIVKEKSVKPSMFAVDSFSVGAADLDAGVFSDLTRSDFIVSDDGRVCRKMVDEFAPPKFFASIRGMEHDQLFTEFNVGAARDKEIENLKAYMLLKETEAAKAIYLCAEACNFKAVEKVIEGVVQPVAPTTAEQRLAKKNKLKAHGTLLITLPDKHQLKFNIHKDAKNLMEAIEKRTNEPVSAVVSVSAASLKIPVSPLPNVDTLSNAVIYSFFASQTNSPHLNNDDLKQIDADHLEEMDLKWQMAMLTVRARRFLQRIGRNLKANGPTSMSLKDTRRNITVKPQRRNVPVDTSTLNALVFQCDGVGSYDWSFQAEEEPTNYALMAFTSSSSSSSDSEVACCSKACTKAYATFQSHYDKLTNDLRKSQFNVISYKTGLESIEARLLVYQQNETVFEKDIKLLKLKVQLRDNALVVRRQKFKKAELKRDDLKLKFEKFQTSSRNLSQLLASQTTDKIGLGYNTQAFTSSMFDCDEMFSSETNESLPASPIYARYQSGEGYHAIPPPHTGIFIPPKPDLVFQDAPNVNETTHTAFNVKLSSTKPDNDLSHRPSAPIIEDWVSDSEDDSEAEIPRNAPSFVQPTEQEKPLRPSVKPVENSILAANHKTAIPKPKTHGHYRNKKACFVCKSLTHLIKYCDYYEKKMAQTPARDHAQRGNHQQYARMTLPNPQRHVVPIAVLTKSKLVSITAARPVTAAVLKPHVTRPRLAKTIVTKPHSPPRRNINCRPYPKTSNFPPKVTTVKAPMDKRVIDSGCSRHMTWNMSYLSDFEEINGRYVAFGGNSKGGKISGKGKIRTGKLDFDDVYFVKELKFNLFSVSQMCDKKNSVLFTDTECIVLSLEFKLPDENQVLLRVPRKNNMYNVDLKNIVPSGDLTYLFAKATLDESNICHRRLGHINFKTMNKLVKGNLVRGLPTKVFENNHTCVACKKGKQHRAYCKTKPNRVLVTKPQNKTPYELLLSRTPSIGFMRPFGCHVTILNTLDPLDKFDGKADKGFLVGYSHIDGDAAFEVKEPEFEGKKPESEVHVSPSSKFEDLSDNSINEVNAVDSPVSAVGQISTNNTNTFSAAGPSNTAVSPTHGKSSYMDPSQYPDDLNMPALEDITYFDDEEDVGAEADFTNLETNITVSPIPTTRVHKDHHEELLQFKMQKVWVSVDLPNRKKGYRNKKDERGIVVRNKARLVAQRHTQEEGIDYEVVFTPVARIEAIRLFLAYASFMGFMVYQIDVKSAFLYGTIEEKALYGLHQAPRAWYETLANYLLENGFQRGKIDETLFIKKQKGDILLVQIYVDNIIFGSTNKDLCKAFEKLMKDKFQMSSMGELTFFLGLQVKQKPDGIFISQDNYVAKILRKLIVTAVSLKFMLFDVSEGFDKITDFLNASSIKYALTINLNIYVSCIKQFWSSVSVKKVNDVTRLQALVNRKKVIITEATNREALRLDDAKSIDCLPNEEIFTELSRMGYEKPSTKLTFYKAFFSPKWKFLIHTILQCMSTKRTSWNEFSSSMASAIIYLSTGAAGVDAVPAAAAEPSIPSPTPTTQPPPPSQELPSTSQEDTSKQGEIIANIDADEDVTLKDVAAVAKEVAVEKDAEIEENANAQGRLEESQAQIYKIDLEHADKVLSMQDDELDPYEAYARELEAELNKNINWDDVIEQVQRKEKEDNVVMRYQALKRKPQKEAQAKKNMMIYLRNMAGFKMDYFKGMSYDHIRPIFDKCFNSNVAFLEKKKAAKKQKLDEEVEELKKHLQTVPNDEDDVYTEATPLAHKVSVVNYEIYTKNNKPYYKIIRANGSPQLFLSFLSLLMNFDREDLEVLWKLVKEIFASSKPKNFSDDFLLTTFTYMFEKPDVQAQVHKLQVSSSGLKEKLVNYKNLTEQLEEFQDAQLKVVNDKFNKVYTDFVEMTLHIEDRFYPHLLTTITRRRWLLTYEMELAIVKCLNSPEYLYALGTAISKAIEKGMQDGLAAGITHGKEGYVLTNVAAYNPSAEMDYVFSLQQLQGVNFPLLAELKSNKDASVEPLMNILRMEEHLAKRLGLNESQPHANQLMVPIHLSLDETLDNIESHRSFLHGVFVPLAEPFSTAALTGIKGTCDTAPSTTTSLSTNFVSASFIPPTSTDDYVVVRLDGQEGAGAESQAITDGNAGPFANVDDVDLNVLQ